jgi:hypothetical protein
MIASKVSFSTHTKEMLNARPMSRTHRAKLRRQRIVEYIRELPFGECKKADLIMAGGWDMSVSSQYANGWSFIERMVKNKVIRMTEGTNLKNSYIKKWEVVADTRIVKPATTVTNDHGKMTYPESDGEISLKKDGYLPPRPSLQLEPVIPEEEPKPINLVDAAKDFAWNTNSDSLREFVAWVKR